MKRFLKLPSPAMIVASTALFVALGGTSYAVATGSIDSREIKNGAIVQQDVKSQGIEGSDIKNGALAARDIKAGSLTADRFVGGQLTKPSRWVLVNAAGQIEAQSGGFSVTAGYPAAPAAANGNVYINSNEDLSDNGVVASIALQNNNDRNADGIVNGRAPDPDANPEFAGEIGASKCFIPGQVTCAPTGTNNVNHFVVSPRESDGTVTTTTSRKRFYVVITG